MTFGAMHQETKGLWLKREKTSNSLQSKLHAKVVRELHDAVAQLKGSGAAEVIRKQGLESLHTVIDVKEVGSLRDRVLDALRYDLLDMAVDIGRGELGWAQNFHVDDYLILRINFPYEVARQADASAENPGIGRLSPQMRDIAFSRRVKDPLFDPKSYHRDHPPAAWAHGPHLDSWAGHSKDGLNLWWAICDVPIEASIVLYPTMNSDALTCDRRTLYLKSGIPLPSPTFVPLGAGDLLIFDPEILHGTHLNVTSRTRIAISLRLNAEKPTFDPDCFYAREFWRTAEDIEQQRYDLVLHLKREENLSPRQTAVASVAIDRRIRTIDAIYTDGCTTASLEPSTVAIGETVVVRLPDRRVMVTRSISGVTAYSAACPHYGVDLSDGSVDDGGIYCPACAVYFDLASGCSSSSCLSLTPISIEEMDGRIVIRPGDGAVATSVERNVRLPRAENQHSHSLTKSHS